MAKKTKDMTNEELLDLLKKQKAEIKAQKLTLKEKEIVLKDKNVELKDKDNALKILEAETKETSGVAVKEEIVEKTEKYSTGEFTIRPDEYVEIMSLCPNDLYLSSGIRGTLPIKFERLGETKYVLYSELMAFINNHPRFTREGIYYIMDERIVKRHGLIDFYDEVLTNDEIALVMKSDSKTAIKMFEMTNKNQQEYLSDMFIKKIVDGEDVDMNMVYKMGKILGTDLAQEAEDAKEFKKLLIKEK